MNQIGRSTRLVLLILPFLLLATPSLHAQGLKERMKAGVRAIKETAKDPSAADSNAGTRPMAGEIAEADAKADGVKVGAIVRGKIGRIGEEDEYRFEGKKGQEINIYFQGLSGLSARLFLELVHTDGNETRIGYTSSKGDAESLLTNFTKPITLEHDGVYTIRISGLSSDSYVGAYRFRIDPLGKMPEALASNITLDQVVTGEAIDAIGDYDIFQFQGKEGQEVVIFLQGLNGSGSRQVRLSLLYTDGNASELTGVSSTGDSPSLTARFSKRVRLSHTGTYTVQVNGYSDEPSSVGPYRFKVALVNDAPEKLPREVRIGTAVEGESIDHVGDHDDFIFRGTKGQKISVDLQGLNKSGTCQVRLALLNGTWNEIASVQSRGDSPAFDARQMDTVTLPYTGEFVLQVDGCAENDSAVGPYRFRVIAK